MHRLCVLRRFCSAAACTELLGLSDGAVSSGEAPGDAFKSS